MDRDDLAFAGATVQAELIRRADVSSSELVELYLERIERLDPELNAFRLVLAERALADARQADARRGAGDDRALLGVPVAVKDIEDVAGEVTAYGTAAHGERAARDSHLVAALRSAGAVIVGKTNLPELAIMGSTEGPAFGVTRNPWDTDRTPGGSSGGSGAAVVAGLCAAATASDGAGSIRIPASCCGLVGLKPQRGRISLAPLDEHWYGLSVAGFVTRSVADTALLLDVAVQPDGPGAYREAAGRDPGRLRIALSLRPGFPSRVDGAVKDSLRSFADTLRRLGHEVREHDPRYGRASDPTTVRYLAGIAQEYARVARPERLQRRTRGFARLGRAVSGLVGWARRAEAGHVARIEEVFSDHDLLLTPACAGPPVGAAEWEGMSALRTLLGMAAAYPFTAVWNMTGHPAISIPAPSSPEGLPIGAQLIAPRDGEPLLLSLAAQLERELDWPARRPPVP